MPQSNTGDSVESEVLSAIQSLTDEVTFLRELIDELRTEIWWANHNSEGESPSCYVRRNDRCSLDPTNPDFTVYSLDRATMNRPRAELDSETQSVNKQQELFG